MGANPGRRDAWPPYRSVRFVLIKRHRWQVPARGLVTGWRRARRGSWEAKVIYVVDDPERIQTSLALHVDWIHADRLVPVWIDPNASPNRATYVDVASQDY
ncbi:hypothetical protein IDH50_11220 [Aeromicrobium tamlense]|uniref:Uncharacterized protein n=1 Tax=Aeromicrobium tamlense TaxID=375541 RepID=A0A8I0KNI5_9ACTN|nr:hypothetical protein [Aeromicrobium tamlense]MBD1270804.1 hypothetical protein [Aeromicrobium tamlense]NYI38196.1 hypothetical protein [Aeromicrobium tamlense]